jgi:guanylate kinase
MSGPSGTGKTSILRKLLQDTESLDFSVSYTTREIRPGEIEGEDYFFVSEKDFKSLIERGEFLEWATVHGNFYGTSRTFVENTISKGRDILLDVDVQGAISIMKKLEDAVYVFVAPPSYEELERRLTSRGTENSSSLKTRLENARWELEQMKLFQYLIINNDVCKSVNQFKAIIEASKLWIDRIVRENGDKFLLRSKYNDNQL